MKFNCGLTPKEKEEIKRQRVMAEAEAAKQWHVRFAWWPVRLTGTHTRVWLEHFEARVQATYSSDRHGAERWHNEWQYRPVRVAN